MADITGAFEVDGLVQQKKELEALLMSNPSMEKKVQKLIRRVLMAARKEISQAAGDAMKSDPRQAYKAVKTSVYRQILGGSVSILNKKHGKQGYSTPEPPVHTGRGGNRRPRSSRTIALQSYIGDSRAFILRFLNAGTEDRHIKFHPDPRREKVNRGSQGGSVQKYGKTTNTGSRGRIAPRNFFANSSHTAMQKAASQLSHLIDNLIKQEFS